MPTVKYTTDVNQGFSSKRCVALSAFSSSFTIDDSNKNASITKIEVTYQIGLTEQQSFFIRAGLVKNDIRGNSANIFASVNNYSTKGSFLAKTLTQVFESRSLFKTIPSDGGTKTQFHAIPTTLGEWNSMWTTNSGWSFAIYGANKSNNPLYTNEYIGDYTPKSYYELGGAQNGTPGTIYWGGTITITITYEEYVNNGNYTFSINSAKAANQDASIEVTLNITQANIPTNEVLSALIEFSDGSQDISVSDLDFTQEQVQIKFNYPPPSNYSTITAYHIIGTLNIGTSLNPFLASATFDIYSVPQQTTQEQESGSTPTPIVSQNYIVTNSYAEFYIDYIAITIEIQRITNDTHPVQLKCRKNDNPSILDSNYDSGIIYVNKKDTIFNFILKNDLIPECIPSALDPKPAIYGQFYTGGWTDLIITPASNNESTPSESPSSNTMEIVETPIEYTTNFNLAQSGRGVGIGMYSTGTQESPKFECAYPAVFKQGIALGSESNTINNWPIAGELSVSSNQTSTAINFPSGLFKTIPYVFLTSSHLGVQCAVTDRSTTSITISCTNTTNASQKIYWLALESPD